MSRRPRSQPDRLPSPGRPLPFRPRCQAPRPGASAGAAIVSVRRLENLRGFRMVGGVVEQAVVAVGHVVGLAPYRQVREGEERGDDARRVRRDLPGIVVGPAGDAVAGLRRRGEIERFAVELVEVPEASAIMSGSARSHHAVERVFADQQEIAAKGGQGSRVDARGRAWRNAVVDRWSDMVFTSRGDRNEPVASLNRVGSVTPATLPFGLTPADSVVVGRAARRPVRFAGAQVASGRRLLVFWRGGAMRRFEISGAVREEADPDGDGSRRESRSRAAAMPVRRRHPCMWPALVTSVIKRLPLTGGHERNVTPTNRRWSCRALDR